MGRKMRRRKEEMGRKRRRKRRRKRMRWGERGLGLIGDEGPGWRECVRLMV